MSDVSLTDVIRTTVGRVLKYNKESGFGFIKIADDKWNDAFVSHRDIEPEVSGVKKLDEGQLVSFDLHKNSKGFAAKNVKILTEQQFNNIVESESDDRFNK
jgi:cold shock CspA family protein